MSSGAWAPDPDARPPASEPSGRTLVVGDVHGCREELEALLDRARWDPARDRLVLVGDVFAKGPDPVGVARLMDRLGAEMVLGNHDAALVARRRQLAERPAGDYATDPHGWCAARLDRDAPAAWRRLEAAPLFLRRAGVLVVHGGVDAELGPEGTAPERLMNLRRRDDVPGRPFWWELWRGPETVVFGHDARRGLVWWPAGDRPRAVGLDTGCVYGGRLTGLLCEEGALVSVPARRAYSPLVRPAAPPGAGASRPPVAGASPPPSSSPPNWSP